LTMNLLTRFSCLPFALVGKIDLRQRIRRVLYLGKLGIRFRRDTLLPQ